jgi:hypothetical protein
MLKNKWMWAAMAGLVGCQGYNVDPVRPLAVKVKDQPVTIQGSKLSPNIMFVVDRSFSMTDTVGGAPAGCVDGSGNDYSGNRNQDCKWNNLLNVMLGPPNGSASGFVDQVDSTLSAADGSDSVSMGLVLFSGQTGSDSSQQAACSAGTVNVQVTSVGNGSNTKAQIKTALTQARPKGATPTAATMAELANDGVFPAADPANPRDNYAILMTDGAPNCNSGFTATEANCGGDRCTLGCGSDWTTCACNGAPIGCLDEDNLVAAIGSLQQNNGIKTFVIGFGQDTTRGSVAETMNQAAVAGGVPQTGSSTSFYQASSQADLLAAFNAILNRVTSGCKYQLAGTPPDKSLVQVEFTPSGGTQTLLTQTQFDLSGSTLSITDTDICNQINRSTIANPAKIEFKYLSN